LLPRETRVAGGHERRETPAVGIPKRRPRGSLLHSPAWSAAVARRTRIICGSCNRAPWGAASAMSLPSRSAGPITVRCIAEAMSRHGGCRWISTPWLLLNGCGTRPAFTVPPRMETSPYPPLHHQFNASRKMGPEGPWDRPTNDIVETI
jgi:hypothetical protein